MAMTRESLDEREENDAGILASVAQLRQSYREASQRVFEEELKAATQPSPDDEVVAMNHLEVIVMVYETMKKTQNPIMLKTMADNGLRSANFIAQLLPKWKRIREEILSLQQQLEERERVIAELTRTIEKTGLEERRMAHQLTVQPVVSMERVLTNSSTPASKRARPNTPSSSSSSDIKVKEEPQPLPTSSPIRQTETEPDPVENSDLPSVSLVKPEMTLVKEDYRKPSKPLCPVCVRPVKKMLAFRCGSCKVFWNRLVIRYKEGIPLKTACDSNHQGVGHTCVFCRRSRYEAEYIRRYPGRELPVPSVLQGLNAGDGGC
uniref:Uncharacterized protein n=1 Tax=Lygus hesperus TaxID=30085 RepID=A0A146KTS0_LYGHE